MSVLQWVLNGAYYTAFRQKEQLVISAAGPARLPLLHAAARGAVLAAGPRPGDRVLDVCAAPGGKSFAAAMAMEDRGEVIACDIHPHKLALIEKGAARLGLGCVRAELADGRERREAWAGAFDLVLCDVPCSGLGVLRRKADLRYRMTVSQEEELVRLQQKILDASAAYVKPGGALVYSTCTVHRAENEENVDWFLAKHPEFVSDMQRQIFPGEEAGDGFFIARLIRVGDEA